MMIHRELLGLIAATTLLPIWARAQDSGAQGSGAPVRHVISIGNHPRVDGLRINFRDRELDLVRGANVTVWSPVPDAGGTVKGLALGLPMTGADRIDGIGLGLLGVSANEDLRGLMIGGIGAGAGGDMRGITFGGIGAGAGGNMRGLTVGGIGAGAGGDLRGITIGGIGAGAGGSVRGFALGGIGVAAGGDARGILVGGIGAGVGGDLRGAAIGGVGVGAGGDLHGLAIGGVGVGAGGDLRGIAIGGVGVGAGGTIHGAAFGIVGVGAPRLEGIVVGSLVRAERVRGLVISPLMFRSLRSAEVRGVTASGVNIVYGSQRGLAIGLVNYAESLNGVQVGGINIVRDNPPGRRVLPIVNW